MTASISEEPLPDPNDWATLAARIGAAARDARQALDHSAEARRERGAPAPSCGDSEHHLRAVVEAIEAVAKLEPTDTRAELTREELQFFKQAGIDLAVFGDASHQQAADWLVLSAVRDAHRRSQMERVAQLTAFDVLPELRGVVDAFSTRDDPLDRYTFLRTPLDELSGLSPVRWLLIGGDKNRVLELVREFDALHEEPDRADPGATAGKHPDGHSPGHLEDLRAD